MPKRSASGIELLADPTRRRIVELLAARPMRPSVIAREIGRSRPATSRQIRLLRDAALIRDLPAPHDGRVRLLTIHPDNVDRVRAYLAGTGLGLLPDRRPPQPRWSKRGHPEQASG